MKTDQSPISKFHPRESASANRRHPLAIVLAFLGLAGCGNVTVTMPTPPADMPVFAIGTKYEPDTCGRIGGNVTWAGAVPDVMRSNVDSLTGTRSVPNPHAPAIHPVSKRLNGAVVYLKAVDPARSKPWVPFPIVVEARDADITILDSGRIGFVRHGDAFQISNEGRVPHVVRGRGAASFAVPLPERGNPSARTASRPGLIHLTSGSNVAPASAYLFVCEHSYYTATKGDGAFAFDNVPAGEYDLVVWHPNWNVVGHDRNPETGLINRLHFGEPFEKVSRVTVNAGGLTTVSLAFP